MSTPVISTNQLVRRFGEKNAVAGLTLEVQPGEIFGFLGHNGAGKTTTVRLLNGVIEPTSGSLRVLGLDPQADGPALRARTGVLAARGEAIRAMYNDDGSGPGTEFSEICTSHVDYMWNIVHETP